MTPDEREIERLRNQLIEAVSLAREGKQIIDGLRALITQLCELVNRPHAICSCIHE